MTFLDDIFARLQTTGRVPILQEFQNEGRVSVTGQELLAMVAAARRFFAGKGLKKGDRCVLLAANSIRWIAADLAAMSEGLIVVPLYSRQAAAELATMMKDCSPALICCGDAALRDMVVQQWPEASQQVLFDDIFAAGQGSEGMVSPRPTELGPSDPVTIIYTSGTSGEAKGAVLTAGNITHILSCTSDQFDLLMKDHQGQDRAFHYAPFCFAASRITMLTSLRRGTLFMLNTDLSKIAEQMRAAAPDYIINVPALLERMRRAVDEQMWKSGGFPLTVYAHGKVAWLRQRAGEVKLSDRFWLALANLVVFPTIRKKMIGFNLKALICGSAPLNIETQLYFMMLGIPVLQVYGLTETTAICTMDDPRQVEPGRVGPAISGIEMKLGENNEILVRGPNIFPGYWNRPAETAKVLHEGWFHTGDQGEVDSKGNWRIAGRIKNLIILNSGHNIAPEPLEDELAQNLPEAQQVVLVGNGRSYLSAIVTGKVADEQVQLAIDALNAHLPHYKQVRGFYVHPEPFTIDSGLLTANGKLKRDAIASCLKDKIEQMYAVKRAV